MIRIQKEDFSVEQEISALVRGNAQIGGVVSFTGRVRDYTGSKGVSALVLEHYPGMTEAELEKIAAAARARFDVERLLVVHRIGRLAVADTIVLVVVAARHRAAAFDACRFLIDHLKLQATFWKKEITGDGAEKWVDSCPGCEAAGQALSADKVSSLPPHSHGASVSWSGLQVGILTLSDSRDQSRDGSGDALEVIVRRYGARMRVREVLPDDASAIQNRLIHWADERGLEVILTTGGTGPGPRDVTPEATRAVCNRELPGLAEQIRAVGLKHTRNAVLTRGVAAFRGGTLVINLPGSTRGATQSLDAVADLVPHALKMARGGGHGTGKQSDS